MRCPYIAAMITSSMESNNLHVKQVENIEVNHVAQLPLWATWLQRRWKMVFSSLDRTNRDDINCSTTENMLTMVASIVYELHCMLIPLLNNHHTNSPTYLPCCRCLNQCNKLFNTQISILNDKKTHKRCRNLTCSRHKVAIRTCSHPEMHSIISWCLMVSPLCAPSATNLMNCMLVTLTRRQQNCYCIVLNVVCIIETTEILIVIDIVCQVGNSLEARSNVIL